MTTATQQRTQEFVTELELKWLELLRLSLSKSVSGYIVFETVTVKPGHIYAERILDNVHCDGISAKLR